MTALSYDACVAEADTVQDKEVFIRHLFKTNPAMGCKILFKTYYAVLCNHALRFVYSKELAEDIVGEVFCKFWERKVYDQVNSSYRSYLFTSVRNSSLNQIKKELGKDAVAIEDAPQQAGSGDPHQVLQATELNNLLERTIQSLPAKCQSVFLMSRMEGKRNLAIATELNISEKAVEAHITKALAKLKQALKEEYTFDKY